MLFSLKKYLFLFLFFIVNVGLIWLSLYTKFDNSVWLDEKNPHQINKDYLYTEFDHGEELVVAIDLATDFFQQKFIDLFGQITKEIEDQDGVVEVKTPLTATTIIQHKKIMEILSFEDALNKNIIPNIKAYKERFTQSDYYGRLLSKDYQKAVLIIKIEAPIEEYNHYRREKIVKFVNTLLAKHEELKKNHFSGAVRLNQALARYTHDDLFILLCIALALICFLLYFIFHNIFRVCVIVYVALTALALSFAIFVLFGYSMTSVGVALPVLILVIAVADVIHIFNRWDDISTQFSVFDNQREILLRTIQETWLPCLLTSVTTAVGFGSFYFSELIPLSQFAKVSLVVIVFSYVIIVSHLWLCLWIFPNVLRKQSLKMGHPYLEQMLLRIYQFSLKAHTWIIASLVLLAVLGIYSFSFLYTETNLLDVFFKKDSVVYQDFEYVDEHLGGTGAIDLIVRSKKKETFREIVSLQGHQTIEETMLDYGQVNYMQSYLTPLRMIHKEFARDGQLKGDLPTNEGQLAQELLFLEFSRGEKNNDVLSTYVDFDYSNSRIHIQTPNLNSLAASKARRYIEEHVKLPPSQKYDIAGSSMFFEILGNYVIDTQIASILVTIVFIWLSFMFHFGFRLSIAGVVANVLPVLLSTAMINYLGIPFDFATVLISSVSFGLCVDDTIHFLHFYKLQKNKA